MTGDVERFEQILAELGKLLGSLGDLAQHLVLVGGQVPALVAREKVGPRPLAIRTSTGVSVVRPYSLEPDLLFDVEGAGFLADRLPDVLRANGFLPVRSYRWRKDLGEFAMEIDFFAPPGTQPPTVMTPLASAERVLAGPNRLKVSTAAGTFEIAVPNPVAFLLSKLDGRRLRAVQAKRAKDSFDLFAYVFLLGAERIDEEIDRYPEERALRSQLALLFGGPSAEGVAEIVEFARPLSPMDSELLARGVVELFEPLMPR